MYRESQLNRPEIVLLASLTNQYMQNLKMYDWLENKKVWKQEMVTKFSW